MIVCISKQNSLIATDVKVAPGGTENVDTEIYEAVVSQPIVEPQVSLHLNPSPRRCPSYFLWLTLLVVLVCSPASASTPVRFT